MEDTGHQPPRRSSQLIWAETYLLSDFTFRQVEKRTASTASILYTGRAVPGWSASIIMLTESRQSSDAMSTVWGCFVTAEFSSHTVNIMHLYIVIMSASLLGAVHVCTVYV